MPRSPRRPQARAQETRERLVAAALCEFADKGFDGATTRAIAARAEVVLASLPYHFKTKDALWRAAVDRIFGMLREQLGRRAAGLEGVDALTRARLLLKDFVLFSAAHPELHRFMLQHGSESTPRLEWMVAEHVRPMLETIRALLAELAADGVALPGDADQLFYMMTGAAATSYAASAQVELATGEDPFAKERVEAHAETVLQLFFPEPASAPG